MIKCLTCDLNQQSLHGLTIFYSVRYGAIVWNIWISVGQLCMFHHIFMLWPLAFCKTWKHSRNVQKNMANWSLFPSAIANFAFAFRICRCDKIWKTWLLHTQYQTYNFTRNGLLAQYTIIFHLVPCSNVRSLVSVATSCVNFKWCFGTISWSWPSFIDS